MSQERNNEYGKPVKEKNAHQKMLETYKPYVKFGRHDV